MVFWPIVGERKRRYEFICRMKQKKYQHKLFAPYLRPLTDTTTTETRFAPRLVNKELCFIRPRLSVICFKAIRYTSQAGFPDYTKINDPKLREIIEGSNFGTGLLKKQREDQDKKKKMEQERKRLEQEREVDRRREEKRAKRNLKVTRRQ